MERQEEEGGGWGGTGRRGLYIKTNFFVYLVWLLLYLTAVCDELEYILHSS